MSSKSDATSIGAPPTGKYEIIYFDIPALGETVRLSMALAGITFEDKRLTGEEFRKHYKESTVYGQMPVVTLPDGTKMAQQRAMTRYFSKFAVVDGSPLYPTAPLEAFFADELTDAVWDIQRNMAKTFSMSGDERKTARENLFEKDGLCHGITKKVEERIKQHGKKYSVSDSLTVADIALFTWMNTLRSGFLDHIPTDYMEKFPEIHKRVKQISNHPRIAAYYTQSKHTSNPKGHYKCFQPEK